MNKTSVILLIIISVSLASCMNIPVYDCKYVENENEIFSAKSGLPFSHYDKDSKIRYDMYHNDSNLYLYFDVSDKKSIYKIFNFGLEVYIDTLGKRKKDVGFIYPVNESMNEQDIIKKQEEMGQNIEGQKLSEIQKSISPEFVLIKNNKEERFNLFALHNELDISMKFDDNYNLSYFAKIPLELFEIDSIPDILTIGILNGDIPDDFDENQEQNVNMQNSTYGNNPVSRRNSMTGSQPYTSPQMGMNQAPQSSPNQIEPIRVWFKLKPQDKNPEKADD